MKLQRYELVGTYDDDVRPRSDGRWCESKDVDKLEALNTELLKALKLMTIICDNVHHSKNDRHGYEEPCPPVERIRAAIAKAEEEVKP